MSADASLISVTAKLAAYYRQFSDVSFAAEVAKQIGAAEAFDWILREHGLSRDQLTFYAPMLGACIVAERRDWQRCASQTTLDPRQRPRVDTGSSDGRALFSRSGIVSEAPRRALPATGQLLAAKSGRQR